MRDLYGDEFGAAPAKAKKPKTNIGRPYDTVGGKPLVDVLRTRQGLPQKAPGSKPRGWMKRKHPYTHDWNVHQQLGAFSMPNLKDPKTMLMIGGGLLVAFFLWKQSRK